MDKIRIVYVDDNPDEEISKYLKKNYEHEDFLKEYEEIPFLSEDGYDSLINDPLIKEANIVLIDSKLFKNDNVVAGKFTGEEFKVILKKMLPFIEVLVVTQNDLEDDFGTIQKYRKDLHENPQEYYEMKLKSLLDDSIRNILIYRNITNKLKKNEGIDKVLLEKIVNSLDGSAQYEELTTKDINEIIIAFRELQGVIDCE